MVNNNINNINNDKGNANVAVLCLMNNYTRFPGVMVEWSMTDTGSRPLIMYRLSFPPFFTGCTVFLCHQTQTMT